MKRWNFFFKMMCVFCKDIKENNLRCKNVNQILDTVQKCSNFDVSWKICVKDFYFEKKNEKTVGGVIHTIGVTHMQYFVKNEYRGVIHTIRVPLWQPPARHFHYFNNRVFPLQNPVKNIYIALSYTPFIRSTMTWF